MEKEEKTTKTYSVCPICLKRIPVLHLKEIMCHECGEVYIPKDLFKANIQEVEMKLGYQ